MNTTELCSNHSILHIVVGAEAHGLTSAAQEMANTEWDNRLFVRCSEDAEWVLKEKLDRTSYDMLVLTPVENHATLEQSLRLSRMAKERGILSMIAVESKTWNAAEFLTKLDLDMEEILAHTDSLILVPGEQHFYSNVTTSLSLAQRLLDDDGFINLDVSDLSAMLKDAGLAYLGCRTLKGHTCEERMTDLDSTEIIPKEILATAKSCLIQMNGCTDIGLEDVEGIVERVQQYLPDDALIVFGAAFDDELQDEIQVSVLLPGVKGHP